MYVTIRKNYKNSLIFSDDKQLMCAIFLYSQQIREVMHGERIMSME